MLTASTQLAPSSSPPPPPDQMRRSVSRFICWRSRKAASVSAPPHPPTPALNQGQRRAASRGGDSFLRGCAGSQSPTGRTPLAAPSGVTGLALTTSGPTDASAESSLGSDVPELSVCSPPPPARYQTLTASICRCGIPRRFLAASSPPPRRFLATSSPPPRHLLAARSSVSSRSRVISCRGTAEDGWKRVAAK